MGLEIYSSHSYISVKDTQKIGGGGVFCGAPHYHSILLVLLPLIICIHYLLFVIDYLTQTYQVSIVNKKKLIQP